MKKIVLFFAMLFVTTIAMSQIKIATNGNIGMGSNDPTKGKVVIAYNGSELPAGMYLYTLVADNEIMDTKRMVLTK
jgi:hypothetical protein